MTTSQHFDLLNSHNQLQITLTHIHIHPYTTHHSMHLRSLIGSVVALGSVIGPTAVSATALTTIVGAQETSCFYLHTHAIGEKIGVYFAVQSGGAFDIDWLVRDNHDKVIMKGTKDKQGDYIFTAQRGGEYSLCFSNGPSIMPSSTVITTQGNNTDMSTFAEKLVDFDFMLGTEEGHAPPNLKPGAIADKTTRLEDSIARLSASLDDITRHQK